MTRIFTDFYLMWLIIFMTLGTCSLSAQTITNLAVSQRTDGSGLVDIFYNLSGSAATYEVSADISFNNGAVFEPIPPAALSGNIGSTLTGINRHIIWNGKGSHNNTYSAQSKIRLNIIIFPCGQALIDPRDGQSYPTLLVNGQCWTLKNMNIGTKIAGTLHQADNLLFEKYCYNNLESSCTVYGGLYQWAEAVQYLNGATNASSWNPVPTGPVQGICPPGWHLPSADEFAALATFLGGNTVAGGKMKEAGTSHWTSPNTGATNSSGLTVLPGGGVGVPAGNFGNINGSARLWSGSEEDATSSPYRLLSYFSASAGANTSIKTSGASVRCVKN
jgi:uncharacterized protein (TIGR02145 family)